MKIMAEDTVSLTGWNSCFKNKPFKYSGQISHETDQKQCCELPQEPRLFIFLGTSHTNK